MERASSLPLLRPSPPEGEGVARSWLPVMEAWLNVRANSANTRRAYRRDVVAAMGALRVRDLRELTGAALATYRAQVVTSTAAPATKARHLAALRSFLVFGVATGAVKLSGDLVRLALAPTRGERARAYRALDDRELSRLLAACPSARDRAIVAVLASSALRRAELAALDCSDLVRQESGYVLQVKGKGGFERVTPLGPDVARLVLGHLAAGGRAAGGPGPLFVADDGRRIADWQVGELVHDAAAGAGLGRAAVSPHALRHTAAARCWRHTRDLRAVQALLGHRSPETTARYLAQLSADEVRASIPPLPAPPAVRRRVLRRTGG